MSKSLSKFDGGLTVDKGDVRNEHRLQDDLNFICSRVYEILPMMGQCHV